MVWTQSHCERLVYDQLAANSFDVFLPTIRTWSHRRGVRHTIAQPMFPGYLFVHHEMDKRGYIDVVKTRGVVRILGESWDRLAVVPSREVDAIRCVVDLDVPVFQHPYVREGHRVRITEGPLAGIEGTVVHIKPSKGMLVVSVDLLQRSVAVELDGTYVVPALTASAPRRSWSRGTLAVSA